MVKQKGLKTKFNQVPLVKGETIWVTNKEINCNRLIFINYNEIHKFKRALGKKKENELLTIGGY